MTTFFYATYILLWFVSLVTVFILLGIMRTQTLNRWRLDQLQLVTPTKIGRNGLKPGARAPHFELPSPDGRVISLGDYSGKRLLLVFTQSGCGSCSKIVPELNRIHRKGKMQVLVVNNGDIDGTKQWIHDLRPQFPVAMQDAFGLSRKYEAYASPFAFQIAEDGRIRSKGIVNRADYIHFVIDGANNGFHEVDL